MSFATSPLVIALLTLSPFVTSRSCYSRNGTLITDVAYQPCSSSGDSACCGTNHSGAGHTGIANDVCEANGLCQNYEAFDGTNLNVKMYWRQGCTDATWSSPNCLASVCDTAEYADDNAPVYSCGDGKWCCGTKSCCSTSVSLFTLAATVGVETVISSMTTESSATMVGPVITRSQISSSSSSTTTTAATTVVEASTSGPTTASASASATNSGVPISLGSSSISTAAKAGIGAGVAVLALLLGIILFLLNKIKKQRKQQANWDKAELLDSSHQRYQKPGAVVSAGELLGHEVKPQEMNANRDHVELEAKEGAGSNAGQSVSNGK